MFSKGITLTVRLGRQKTSLASRRLIEAIQSIEVTHRDEGRSGFQIVFQVGRLGASDLKNYALIKDPLITPGNRVILSVALTAKAYLLMDGIITHQQFSPSMEPGASTFTITGEDISVMMDRQEGPVEHPEQDEKVIVEQLLGNYSQYGLRVKVENPPIGAPSRSDRIPVKQGTDLEQIQALARRNGFVFYVTPGPRVEQNTVYWGPPKKPRETPQRALTANMGAFTNLESINFQHNALSPTTVSGRVQDRRTNRIENLSVPDSDRPHLSASPSINNQTCVRRMTFQDTGHTFAEARSRSQATTNRSVDSIVTATGEVDTLRYGALLQIRQLVGLRGIGHSYDGLYYVKQVTHKLRKGEYKQNFTITREGVDTTVERLPV
ncbi:MAG: hypothetical protein KME10_12140 [Plectolyngbya sp. WJT66-NPBG17]|jgi:hypothetical protein|nr:hypothetical protein [Plectolyngbya sp. WJT66-NPBG17]